MSIGIDKAKRFYGENKLTIEADRVLTPDEQLSGVIYCEGTLSADRYLTFQPQLGGVWWVHNGTSGGFAIFAETTFGNAVKIPNGATVMVVQLRLLGMVAVAGSAAYLNGIPFTSTVAQAGQLVRSDGSSYFADYSRKTVRSTSGSVVAVAITDEYVLCTGTNAGVVNVNLPNVALVGPGRVFTIADGADNAHVNSIFINPYAGQDIDTGSSFEINVRRANVSLISRSGGWDIICSKGV